MLRESLATPPADTTDIYHTAAQFLREQGFNDTEEVNRILDIAMNPNSLHRSFRSRKRTGISVVRLLSSLLSEKGALILNDNSASSVIAQRRQCLLEILYALLAGPNSGALILSMVNSCCSQQGCTMLMCTCACAQARMLTVQGDIQPVLNYLASLGLTKRQIVKVGSVLADAPAQRMHQ